VGDIAVYGQESNHTTWRLAKMNLAIRGIDANLGPEHADSFRRDLHPDLKADYVLANPPFNDSDWGGAQLRDDAGDDRVFVMRGDTFLADQRAFGTSASHDRRRARAFGHPHVARGSLEQR
jgi:type I restriction-modification system DNA methylase subunit